MNPYLEKLFETYNLSPKDRFEIRQIYSLLPLEKQKNLMNNFETLAHRLKVIEEEVKTEREILLGKALDKVGQAIQIVRQEKIKGKIDTLKNEI